MVTATNAGGASGAGRNSRNDLLQFVGTLNSLFGGGATKTSTSSTSTEGKQVSPEALQSIIRTMQSQANGLASVLQPQRSAGLYGSSTNQQLAQQFAENVAGKAAEISTPTVRTNNQVQMMQPQTSDMAKALAGIGAAAQLYSMGKGVLGNSVGRGAAAVGGGTLAQIYGGNLDSNMSDLTAIPSDWIANTPGSEAADFLTAEGFGDAGITLGQLSAPAAAAASTQSLISGADTTFSPLDSGSSLLSAIGDGGGDFLSSVGDSISDAASSAWDWVSSWF